MVAAGVMAALMRHLRPPSSAPGTGALPWKVSPGLVRISRPCSGPGKDVAPLPSMDHATKQLRDRFAPPPGLPCNRAAFERALDAYCRQEVRRRGHVEFVYAALRQMPIFGVERELDIYNRLLDVFPKEVFVARSYIQRMFNHFPRQQECAVQVLEQMENYGVMPDVTTKVTLLQIFGHKSHPIRKFQRLLYWFPRFRHVNPFPMPQPLPRDPVELAGVALRRMTPDLDAEVTVYQHPGEQDGDLGLSIPHIVGIQSPDQRALLASHDSHLPVFVEGPYPLWLHHSCVHYHVLRSDPLPPSLEVTQQADPERNLGYPAELTFDLERDLSEEEELDVEEVEEGPVYALCQAGSMDISTLTRWISGLQQTNPTLRHIPVVFRLSATTRELEVQPADVGGAEESEEEELGSQRMQN
ncbi:evolutionarily conserved signaling intermediate in Toll pathway, mitochondrial [Narcine bancroftii]|uniref:evolutionarily conserved signaling intermediate in Toll pathway, mitochondrial n=1 Tax=Narcine bancroftii TaxID=1343680 RepID=UPI003831D316